jgi:hypothetical protein
LPDSGHACLLEKNVNLFQLLQSQDFLSPVNVYSTTSVNS